MASIFTKIINGEIPCYKIAEDEHCFAFLDINPNAKGHTLCIPKKEIDKIFDIEEDLYTHLLQFARKIAKALEQALPCERIGMAVVGLEVHHAHIHLIPISRMAEMTFQEKVSLTPEEFEQLAEHIKSFL